MTNEEIAVRLAAAILVPSVALPARRAAVDQLDEQIVQGADLAVRTYEAVLSTLQKAEPAP